MNVLVVCSVPAERDALLAAGVRAPVIVGGVGPAASAAAASAACHGAELVLCAGIGGGFGSLRPGDVAVASSAVFADLGAESPDGFLELDVAPARYPVEPRLAVELADRTGGHLGTVLTVATVTGTRASADALIARFPDAVAEGMEGAGVAAAAAVHGAAFAEVRAISNVVGPRDRDAWEIPRALAALGAAVAEVTS